ncbi:MAG: hypothetical protein QM683_08430 [Lacrimispora sp.]
MLAAMVLAFSMICTACGGGTAAPETTAAGSNPSSEAASTKAESAKGESTTAVEGGKIFWCRCGRGHMQIFRRW